MIAILPSIGNPIMNVLPVWYQLSSYYFTCQWEAFYNFDYFVISYLCNKFLALYILINLIKLFNSV